MSIDSFVILKFLKILLLFVLQMGNF